MPPRKSLAIDPAPHLQRFKVTEHAIQNAILAQLKAAGLFVWRQNTGMARDPRNGAMVTFGLVGQGDITGILPGGRRLEIECKRPDGKLTDAQREFGDRVVADGGLYVVARDVRTTVDLVLKAARQ